MPLKRCIIFSLLSVVIITSCVSMPTSPTVMPLPGHSMTFEQYKMADAYCRSETAKSLEPAGEGQQAEQMATGAVVAGLIGAAAGAVVGAVVGDPGAGAAIGGTAGGLFGVSKGAQQGQSTAQQRQHQYNQYYRACMYAYNNQVSHEPVMSR